MMLTTIVTIRPLRMSGSCKAWAARIFPERAASQNDTWLCSPQVDTNGIRLYEGAHEAGSEPDTAGPDMNRSRSQSLRRAYGSCDCAVRARFHLVRIFT